MGRVSAEGTRFTYTEQEAAEALTRARRLFTPYVHLRVKSRAYRFLWLRYVWGFDITQHCAKCLIGHWSKRVPFLPDKRKIRADGMTDEVPDAPYLYLCGVTDRWENNLHVAMRRAPRGETSVETPDIRAHFVGWEQVEIPPLPDPLAYPRLFATCRNFQFGYRYLMPPATEMSVPGTSGRSVLSPALQRVQDEVAAMLRTGVKQLPLL